jgi:S-DNA-T family DNA segregation ATPase FtsK/SpoIIIE
VTADLTRPSVWLNGLLAFWRHDKTREAVGVLAMAAALLTLAALATFDSHDPSFFTFASSAEHHIRNAVGRVGAEAAGDLLGLLGLSALLAPPVLFYWGWTWVGGRRLADAWRRGLGLLLLIPSLSLLATVLHQVNVLPGGRVERPGGFVGDEAFRLLVFSFGTFGLAILALTGLALAVICLSERPFASLLAWPSAGLHWIATRAGAILAGWKERRTEAAQVKRKAEALARSRATADQEAISLATTLPDSQAPATQAEAGGAAPSPAKESGREKEKERQTRPSKGQQAFPFLPGGEGYAKPSVKFLDSGPAEPVSSSQEEMAQNSRLLEKKLLEFGVEGRVTAVNPGPVITSYELEPGPGIKINRIVALADDLALGLKAMSVRVVAPIPGKAAVGVEIPNQRRATVYLRDVLTSKEFAAESLQLPLALGQESGGAPMVTDLTQMPHLLIAGETGSGKSVCVNSLILSLVYRAQPKDVRLLLIDPKRVELSVYNGIPHLVDKVVVDPKDAARRLQRVVLHMEERYKLFAHVGARNLQSYNRKMALEPPPEDALAPGVHRGPLPLLVVVIDELADLMLTAQGDVENAIMRLAQMARAVGIHLIVATQRPSVDVLTGVIKANFPARISFRVASKVDSRTILDMNGAEALLGKGDMLFVPPGSSRPIRIHGCNVTEIEIRRVVEFLANQAKPEELAWSLLPPEPEAALDDDAGDEFYREAVEMVIQTQQASISMLQRRLRVGFNRAARMIERMEREGIVSPMDGTRPREVLVSKAES